MKYIASALLILTLCTALSACNAGAVAEMPAPESTDPVTAPASEPSLTLHHFGHIGYWLYSPENSRPGLKLVVYLHGGSGKGSDASLVLQNGFPKLLKEGLLGRPNCYILIPQLSDEYRDWAEMQSDLFALLDDVTARFDIDGICLTGHSMGGTATWTLALAAPERFCCIVPLSGSIQNTAENRAALSKLPVRAFVGSEDTIVSPRQSIAFIRALQKNNPNAQITVIPGADHFAVPDAYTDEKYDILGWMLSQS